ncbi:MAG: hypothetical protein APF81_20980 [Desulfosporosinus sp. BRH_c37]|nr:MAG: hypothetical protein APF81_20980 [Desulfosporosinus sp. BRH_c37]
MSIAEHDVKSMTKLELQQAVKDREQAIQEKKDFQKDLNLKSSKIAQLTTQAKSLEKQVMAKWLYCFSLFNKCNGFMC